MILFLYALEVIDSQPIKYLQSSFAACRPTLPTSCSGYSDCRFRSLLQQSLLFSQKSQLLNLRHLISAIHQKIDQLLRHSGKPKDLERGLINTLGCDEIWHRIQHSICCHRSTQFPPGIRKSGSAVSSNLIVTLWRISHHREGILPWKESTYMMIQVLET